ncbi:NTP pyrophosphohydrolase [Luteibacter phage vB_LflM-Pluto]|uniref:NTP pyrophosphohydrolase n=1 Tax=Luteibacter phage vB_LflM-Pluto TaxID=2948611 RepID=A0A9E7SLS1_9CAUD|nr:NTP pyrophosphohydrolase [Luteibacter phage vB_LflM-Pluto]
MAISAAEVERLAILSEESGEVIRAVGKIMRHGYESTDPTGKDKGTNREQLENELGNLLLCLEMMEANGDINLSAIIASAKKKSRTINKYLYFNVVKPHV